MSNSSPIDTHDPTDTTQPWDVPGWIPDKRGVCDYGYVSAGNAVGCDREELLKEFAARGPAGIKFVWTPETFTPVFPEKVPLLVEGFKRIAVRSARNNLLLGLGLIGFGLVLALLWQDWRFLYLNVLSIFGALEIVEGSWQLIRSRHYTQEEAEADASGLRFDAWIRNKKINGYTLGLAAFIVAVGIFQIITDPARSIEAAGLVKHAVWEGQAWRLLTACLMHGSFMHFWFNFLALLHFSRITEQTLGRAYVPLVFLVSGALGSVFSVLLYPNTTSVGASGGLMGLLGFITVGAYLDRKTFPPKYLRNSIEGIAMVGMFGLIGFAFIDNAAHLGGLCGGLLLGWLLLRPYNQVPDKKKIERQLSILGLTALGILALIALMAIIKIWG
jgi:membrane associated rhomboid family serine protease